ncbi:hypothetical protein ABZ464_02790 [Streptomyces sp. NPDC005820]|uniref:hypothetical protein n=1 Tax=Streptomyces sp. NPDC005820 TaxID=3157069 RepID=UPI0033CC3C62
MIEPKRAKQFSTPAKRAAHEWTLLDQEEKEARRDRKARRAALTRRKDRPRNGPIRTLRVHPAVMRTALRQAGGDASRIRIVSETEVWVV